MKKNLIVLLLFANTLGYAQPYQSLFGNTSSAWKIVVANLFGEATDSLRTGNDTTVNAIQYKIIISDYVVYNPQHIHGLLREDTLSGKVWYYSISDSTERLVMDMALTITDSFYFEPYPPFPLDTGWVIVDSVYYVSGKKYIRFNSSTAWEDKLIFVEGIGPNLGIQYLSEILNTAPFLLCSYKDNIIEYTNNNLNFNNCLLLSVTEEKNKEEEISIYPNPTNGKFRVESLKFGVEEIEIYDLFGRLLLRSKEAQIDMSSYTAGLYIYRIGAARGKLVIE